MESLFTKYTHLLLSLTVAAGSSFIVLHLMLRVAPRIGLMDTPGGHRIHEGETPLIGGIAIFFGFFFGILTLDVALTPFRPLFLASGLLILVGVLDDLHELSAASRFAIQILAGLIMTLWGGLTLNDLGYLVNDDLITIGKLSVPLTIFAVVGVVNSFNMSDGMDGQAGSLFLVAFSGIGWLVGVSHVAADYEVLLVLVCSLLVFMSHNLRIGTRNKAIIFLGDAGSMFLGFVVCWYLVKYSQEPYRVIYPVTALWLVALPLFDTVSVMLRRIFERKSPFSADRTHYHHIIQALGFSVNSTLAVIALSGAVLAVIGIIAQEYGVPESTMFIAFLALFLFYFVVATVLTKKLQLS